MTHQLRHYFIKQFGSFGHRHNKVLSLQDFVYIVTEAGPAIIEIHQGTTFRRISRCRARSIVGHLPVENMRKFILEGLHLAKGVVITGRSCQSIFRDAL